MPDIHPDDGYPQQDVYEAAQFLLKGTSSLQAQQTSTPSSSVSPPTIQPPTSYPQRSYAPPPQQSGTCPVPGVVVKQEYNMRNTNTSPPSCYFCGVSGHTTRYCREINAYERDRKLARTSEGRLVLADGSQIPNEGGALLKERIDHFLKENRVQRA
jgi:hypothetical protein